MAGPKKKKATDEGAQSSESIEAAEFEAMMLAEFEGRNPDAIDFDGIKQLLKQLFLKAHVNISELSDLIIAQQGLGSVLKQAMDDDDDDEEDEDGIDNTVFGVTTVINLTANMEKPCVTDLINLLKQLAKDHAEKKLEEQITDIFSSESRKIALLLNERFINIPAKIADPLMSSLQAEVQRIATKNPSYNFDYYIMICKMHKQVGKNEMFFANAEEEIFSNSCDFHFEFSVANDSDTGVGGTWTEDDVQLTPMRRVLFINAQKFPTIVNHVKQFVN